MTCLIVVRVYFWFVSYSQAFWVYKVKKAMLVKRIIWFSNWKQEITRECLNGFWVSPEKSLGQEFEMNVLQMRHKKTHWKMWMNFGWTLGKEMNEESVVANDKHM